MIIVDVISSTVSKEMVGPLIYFEKVLCMVTPPPPHQPKIEYFNIFTFEGGGQSKEFFEGGTPQTKSGSAGKRPTLVDAKNAFIRPN